MWNRNQEEIQNGESCTPQDVKYLQTDKQLSYHLKLRVIKCSTLLNGTNTWIINKQLEERKGAVELKVVYKSEMNDMDRNNGKRNLKLATTREIQNETKIWQTKCFEHIKT